MQLPGWYLTSGTGKMQSSIWDIRFPISPDEGPISREVAFRLLDRENPFRMSVGQWLFVHAKWMASQETSPPSADSDPSPPPPILEVQTTLLAGFASLFDGVEETKSDDSREVKALAAMAAGRSSRPSSVASGDGPVADPDCLASRIAMLENDVYSLTGALGLARDASTQAMTECARQAALLSRQEALLSSLASWLTNCP